MVPTFQKGRGKEADPGREDIPITIIENTLVAHNSFKTN
jgi:hypothetical protein